MTSWISDSARGQASSRPGRPPKSKSHAHRILILALAAETNSRISNRNAEFCIRSMTQLSRGDEKLLHSFVWCNPVSGSQIKELVENQARRGQEPSSPPKVPFPPSASPLLSPAAPLLEMGRCSSHCCPLSPPSSPVSAPHDPHSTGPASQAVKGD